jgi:hypothetical protein
VRHPHRRPDGMFGRRDMCREIGSCRVASTKSEQAGGNGPVEAQGGKKIAAATIRVIVRGQAKVRLENTAA